MKGLLSSIKQYKQLLVGLGVGVVVVSGVGLYLRPKSTNTQSTTNTEALSMVQGEVQEPTKEVPEQPGASSPSNPVNNITSAQSNTTQQTSAPTATTPAPAPTATTPPPKKVSNWSVIVYQSNLSCGSEDNKCSMPAGLVISIIAVDNDTGQGIPLSDCSLTAGPVGFSIPGGSWSGNPTVYSDGGDPVCGGSFDFPMSGHYRLSYEVWPADSVNMDLKYRGGTLQDFYVQ